MLNPNFLKDAGTWFEDHFAFRDEAITAYALLLEKGFGVSAQERVITGKDGWLFYKDSLADFQGTAPMSERQLFDTAHSLAMIQEYARQHGAAHDSRFVSLYRCDCPLPYISFYLHPDR